VKLAVVGTATEEAAALTLDMDAISATVVGVIIAKMSLETRNIEDREVISVNPAIEAVYSA